MTISAADPDMTRNPSPWPTVLTSLRVAAGPLVGCLVLYADGLVFSRGAAVAAQPYGFACMAFVLAAATDAIDGPLARRLNSVTRFGAALDHAADKVLLACALIVLAATSLPPHLVVAAFVLIGRDLLIGGVREGMAQGGKAVPVGRLGKIKTALAFVGVGVAMATQWAHLAGLLADTAVFDLAVAACLWAAVVASVVSATLYLRAAAG